MTSILVVDAHEITLVGMASTLKEQYPHANIHLASTYQEVKKIKALESYNLIISDIYIPSEAGAVCKVDTGLGMLQEFIENYSGLNIVIHSDHARALIRLKPIIEAHKAGFTISNKGHPISELLTKIDWSLQGLLYTPPDMRSGLEIKPEWLKLLKFTFYDGLTDKAVAKTLNVSERTIRHYWTRTQDELGIYPDEGINIRIQTFVAALKSGLLDEPRDNT